MNRRSFLRGILAGAMLAVVPLYSPDPEFLENWDCDWKFSIDSLVWTDGEAQLNAIAYPEVREVHTYRLTPKAWDVSRYKYHEGGKIEKLS